MKNGYNFLHTELSDRGPGFRSPSFWRNVTEAVLESLPDEVLFLGQYGSSADRWDSENSDADFVMVTRLHRKERDREGVVTVDGLAVPYSVSLMDLGRVAVPGERFSSSLDVALHSRLSVVRDDMAAYFRALAPNSTQSHRSAALNALKSGRSASREKALRQAVKSLLNSRGEFEFDVPYSEARFSREVDELMWMFENR